VIERRATGPSGRDVDGLNRIEEGRITASRCATALARGVMALYEDGRHPLDRDVRGGLNRSARIAPVGCAA